MQMKKNKFENVQTSAEIKLNVQCIDVTLFSRSHALYLKFDQVVKLEQSLKLDMSWLMISPQSNLPVSARVFNVFIFSSRYHG